MPTLTDVRVKRADEDPAVHGLDLPREEEGNTGWASRHYPGPTVEVDVSVETLQVAGMDLPVFRTVMPARGDMVQLQWEVDASVVGLREMLKHILKPAERIRGAFMDWEGQTLILQCVVDREDPEERSAAYRAEHTFRRLFPSIRMQARLLDASDVVGGAVPGAQRVFLR